MLQSVARAGEHVFGRESELGLLESFLATKTSAAFVLTGKPGMGKTTLWKAAVDQAQRRGLRVLTARPGDAETGLSFSALADLLEDVELHELDGVPAPQLRALQIALFRADPGDQPPDSFAIAAGFLNALRALARRESLVVAVDDVPWLDRPSADALVYTARRLPGHEVRFLLARRPGKPSALEAALEPVGLDNCEIGPLSLGATRALLSERLDLTPPRRVLRQVFETGQGNPLFMIEIGRVLATRGFPEIGAELPVPDRVEDLLGMRVAELSDPVRKLLLAVALNPELRVPDVSAIADPVVLEDAVELGVLNVTGDRVRASHPLLAAAARRQSRAPERRKLHQELAGAVADQQARVRYLALASEEPDPELATTVAAAARVATARGARQEAVELGEQALRLTPPEATERVDRLLTLAHALLAAGDSRARDLLLPEMDSVPPGEARVRAYLLLARIAVANYDDIERFLQRALSECGGDPVLRAGVLAEIATVTAVIRVERIADAEAWALEALEAQPQAGPEAERAALEALAWTRGLRGRQIDDVCARYRAASEDVSHIVSSPERVLGQQLVWRGHVDRARAVLTGLLSVADEQGEPYSYALQRLHMCELELRVGAWDAAERILDEWAESFDLEVPFWPMYERCRALLAAGRGLPDEAERWATEAVGRAETTGVRWDKLEALRARGTAALLRGDPTSAVDCLRPVWAHTRREGVDEPGVFPVAPDLVEALAEVGAFDEARAATSSLRAHSEEMAHPWGLATAERCDAQILLAAADDDHAVATLERAASDLGGLGLLFDRARALLQLGRSQRRLKKWGTARRSLEQAAAAFDEIESPGWAEQARSELTRVGARRPRPKGALTPAEQRVAALAAKGLSNKEIAADLFVTVHTVEAHLSHVYAKLGVRSRGQLARRIDALR